MGLYTGDEIWRNEVYEIDTTDVALGGPGGAINKAPHDLADRTAWLKAQIGRVNRLEGEVALTDSAPIPGTLAGNLIVAYSTAVLNLTLEDAATFPHGAIIPINSYCNPGCVVNILTTGGQVFIDPVNGAQSTLSAHHKEYVIIIALTDHFKVWFAHPGLYTVGEEIKARKIRLNTLAFQGQLLQRSRYPRLWKYVNEELTMWQEKCDEALWFYDATTYRGLFTTGDGVSTFRLPDERGTSERMLDSGRGIDISRTHNFAGGYEGDQLKQHGHRIKNGIGGSSTNALNGGNAGNTGISGMDNHNGWLGNIGEGNFWIEATGGPENIVKNIAKLNLVKF